MVWIARESDEGSVTAAMQWEAARSISVRRVTERAGPLHVRTTERWVARAHGLCAHALHSMPACVNEIAAASAGDQRLGQAFQEGNDGRYLSLERACSDAEAKVRIAAVRRYYNEVVPHRGFGYFIENAFSEQRTQTSTQDEQTALQ